MITRTSVICNVKRICNVEKIVACGNMKASGRGKTLVKGARETGLREGLLEKYFEKMKLLVRKQTKSFKYEKL